MRSKQELLDAYDGPNQGTKREVIRYLYDNPEVEHEPESIRELARLVDRNPPEVLENVNELADYGLVELEENGRAKRPVVWYDEIDADIPLTTGSGQGRKANA